VVLADVAAYLVFFLVVALYYALLCLGLNLQWGVTGLFNVGVAGFVAVGAYASALLTGPPSPDHWGGLGFPVAAGWLGASCAAGLCALLVGAITLRLRHDYLAIATFGIAVTIQLVALNFVRLTNGPFGITHIPRPFAAWAETPVGRNALYLLLVALVVIVTYVGLERLVRSPWGRVLRGLREDEVAAATLGKSPTRYRLEAFVLGAMVMGLAGAVYAHFVGFIAPEDFLPILTFQVWTMLVVGGSGSNRGALMGGVVVWGLWSGSGALVAGVLPQALQARGAALQVVVIGVVLAAMLLCRPRGLLGEDAVVSRHVFAARSRSDGASGVPPR
jgi:branched-chain amino acid transport system permease protein